MRKILGIIGSALAVIAVIIGVVIFVLPNLRFGAGTGDGSGVVSGSSISTNKPSKSDLSKENKNSERITGNHYDNKQEQDVPHPRYRVHHVRIFMRAQLQHQRRGIRTGCYKGTRNHCCRILQQ